MTGTSRRQFLPALHGLRGLMALWILAYHTSPNGFGLFRVSSYGYLAVDVFFVLSGYVLMHSHGGQFKCLTWTSSVSFWRLRWWRVYPLCLLSVILSISLFHALRGFWPTGGRIIESLLILDGWARPGIGLNVPAWSLGVEVVGYLAFPLVARCLMGLNGRQSIVCLALVLSAATVYMSIIDDTWDHSYGFPAVARMTAGFGAGCLLFTLEAAAPSRSREYGDILIGAAVAGLACVLLADQLTLVLPFLACLVYGAAASQGRGAAVLGSWPFLFFGRISFSLYLTHFLVMEAVVALMGGRSPRLLDKLAGTGAVVTASIGLAWLVCVTVEEPVRRWGRRRPRLGAGAALPVVVSGLVPTAPRQDRRSLQ